MSGRRLDPATAARLAKVLGRLGSDFDAERATAGRMADQLVRAAGLSWETVLGVVDAADDAPPECHRELARWVLARLPDLGERDRRFLGDMSTWLREPSPKQRAWLAGLALRAGVAA
jgi:hypothetical protein